MAVLAASATCPSLFAAMTIETKALLEQAKKSIETLPPDRDVIDLWTDLAIAQVQAGDAIAAWASIEKAIAVAEAADSPGFQTIDRVLGRFAKDRFKNADREGALKAIEKAVALAGKSDGVDRKAALRTVSEVQALLGQYKKAFQIGCFDIRCGTTDPIAVCDPLEGDALEFAGSKRWDKALETVASIKDQVKRNRAAGSLAWMKFSDGDYDGALALAEKSSDARTKDVLIDYRSRELAGKGDASDALNLIKGIKDAALASRARGLVITFLSDAGRFTEALSMIEQVQGDRDSRFWGLFDIARKQRARGDEGAATTYAQALKAAQARTKNDPGQSGPLRELAYVQTAAGDAVAARATAESIADEQERAGALAGIAKEQARQGDFAGAVATADTICIDWERVMTERFDKGDSKGALEAGERFVAPQATECNYDRDDALSDIAKEQAMRSLFADAWKTIGLMKNLSDFARESALQALAPAQARAGDVEGALKAADVIDPKSESLSKRVKIMIAIAHAQAERGDAVGVLKWVEPLNPYLKARVLIALTERKQK